jgi:hypothetical protein
MTHNNISAIPTLVWYETWNDLCMILAPIFINNSQFALTTLFFDMQINFTLSSILWNLF